MIKQPYFKQAPHLIKKLCYTKDKRNMLGKTPCQILQATKKHTLIMKS